MKRPLFVFAAILCIAALLFPAFQAVSPVHPGAYWAAVIVIAGLVAAGARGGRGSASSAGGGEFLCDTCKFNDARYCSRPERPNATACPEYKGRGSGII